MEEWLFIVNSTAGRGRAEKKLKLLQDLLKKGGFHYRIECTSAPLHAMNIARNSVQKGFRKIVSVGGDGTLNEIVNGIMQSKLNKQVKLGIIPEGGGNDFTKNLHISSTIFNCLSILNKEKTMKIDLGKIEDHFLSIALVLDLMQKLLIMHPR